MQVITETFYCDVDKELMLALLNPATPFYFNAKKKNIVSQTRLHELFLAEASFFFIQAVQQLTYHAEHVIVQQTTWITDNVAKCINVGNGSGCCVKEAMGGGT